MTMSDIMGMAGYLLKRGAAVTAVLAIVFAAGYFLVYKLLFKGRKRLRLGTAVLGMVFLCYLLVVCGATLGRGNGWQTVMLGPFSSYRDAWYSFSEYAWRNLILNILMFVPLGFLLPCLFRTFRRPWAAYGAGAGFSLLLELIQLIFHLGVFETDDILNNFAGTVIGYGFYRLGSYLLLLFRRRKDRRLGRALLFQAPLCAITAAFCVVFLAYHFQELGNLRSAYYGRVSMKNVDVRLDAALSEEAGRAQVFRCRIADKGETLQIASDFFAGLGDRVDMSREDYYENTAIFFSDDNFYSLWIEYAGPTMEYNNHDAAWDGVERIPMKEDADREEIEEALSELGVSVHKDAVFENLGEGKYLFTMEQVMDGEYMYDGTLRCVYHVNHQISEFNDRRIAWEKYKELPLKTEREAYEEILAGRFRCDMEGEKPDSMVIRGVRLGYELDSKGFYQPIYVFDVLCNQADWEIAVPALR